MGRPLNKKLFGDPTSLGNQFNIEAWIPDGSGGVSAWILRQHTNNTYLVTDGSDTGRCRLQEGTLTAAGQMRMTAMPFGFDIATATASMKAVDFAFVDAEGTGYEPGDAITLTGGTSTTDVVLTVGKVRSITATTVVPGTGSTPGNALIVVDGTPINGAATINVASSKAVSASVAVDGEGYVPGEIITLAGGTFSSAATVEVTSVGTWTGGIDAAGSGYFVGNTVDIVGGTGTAPTFDITSTKAVSATVADEGAGHSVIDTLTVVGGSFGIAAIFDIDTVGTVISQNELDFDGTGANGTFTAGTLYIALDTITYTDGTVVTIDVVASGVVTDFTITTASLSGSATDGDTLVQDSTTSAAGTGFVPTLGVANQSVFTVSVNTVGAYILEPTNDVFTTSSNSGTFAKLTVLYGALLISINAIGDLIVIPTNAAATTGVPGSGLTINLAYKIVTAALDSSGSGYTVLPPSDPVSQDFSDGSGSNGEFTMDWGVDTVTISSTAYTIIPTNSVATTGGGNDATFNIEWAVDSISGIATPGDYTEIPSNSVSQGSVSPPGGSGATFFVNWGVLAVTVTDDGGGYVSPPAVTFTGGSGTAATSTLTTVGGSTPPDEAVASITVISDGEGYTATANVIIAAPVGDVEYIRILNAHQIKTWEGNVYTWSEFLADSFDEVDVDIS